MKFNICTGSDSYKATHYCQYPKGTTKVYSYLESRGGRFNETVFFGLQYILKEYLTGQVVTKEKVDYAEQFWNAHFGRKDSFKRELWDYIVDNHNGHLPIKIKAIPEGLVVPTHNVLMTIENTDPNCWWLTNFLETLLVQVWYPITIATNSRECKKVILKYLEETGDPSLISFKLNDFGFRGVSSRETAAIGGASHLVNFLGTDNVAGIELLMQYYNSEMCAFSIPASEHSTITSWGPENEVKAFENMLNQYPEGLVACVSDSFDIENACDKLWGTLLKDKVMKRNGTLVVRPDSGDPVEVTLKVIEILGDRFGFTINDKGYKVLDPHVRIIQGDGIDYEMIVKILENYKQHGWSTDNIAFGSGGGLLQKFDRDTQKFAMKCSSITINGEDKDVFKQPKTDSGKNSKRGKLKLAAIVDKQGNVVDYETLPDTLEGSFVKDELITVFENGKLLVDCNLENIRKRAEVKNQTLQTV